MLRDPKITESYGTSVAEFWILARSTTQTDNASDNASDSIFGLRLECGVFEVSRIFQYILITFHTFHFILFSIVSNAWKKALYTEKNGFAKRSKIL